MTFSTLTAWLIDFRNIDFWYIDKIHIWLFDTLTKETYDLLQGSPVVGIVVGTVVGTIGFAEVVAKRDKLGLTLDQENKDCVL